MSRPENDRVIDPDPAVAPPEERAAGGVGPPPTGAPQATVVSAHDATSASAAFCDSEFTIGSVSDAVSLPGFSYDNMATVGLPPAPTPLPRGTLPTVPGYEILAELGRGGMGVVYKARQVRLNRLVALKMVLAGPHAGSEQLARFFTEAEAVAHLVHPHIIQIHEIGDHDGLPFFSLEFVDGGSLSDRLNGKPMPARKAAELVQVLAQTMGWAHDHGVIHRDLKPANVLLDAGGCPKIADFGLAKRLEADSSQTRSGSLMGTPNYMAPEQARGDTHEIGPLADVYALGVILYECLTGRPPFVGSSIVNTLKLVQTHEPVPPSRLEPTVPADLETICLKCLQKEMHKRYASAAEFADDLGRFLSGAAIKARPVGPAERLVRWCRRNPRVAGLSAAVLGLLVTVAVGSTVMAYRIARERREAVAAREAADRARELADRKAQDEQLAREAADRSAEQARQAQARADANAKVANDQARLALSTLQILVDKVQKRLDDAPRTQVLKKELLQTALGGLQEVAQHAEKSSSTEATTAAAHMRMGHLFRQLGDTDAAFRQYALCHEITRKRAAAQPARDAAQANLAATFTVLGDMSQELRRDMTAAADYYRQAAAIREQVYLRPHGGDGKVDPLTAKRDLAEAHTRVAVTVLRLGDPAGSAGDFGKALALRQELVRDHPANTALKQDLARTYNALGEVSFRSGDRDKARDYYDQCLAERDALLRAKPDDLKFKRELAAAAGNSGDFQLRCGYPAEARGFYDRSLKLGRELAAADPENADYQRELGLALYRAGVLARAAGDAGAVAPLFRECLQVRRALAKDSGNERRQTELMLALAQCGEHTQATALAATVRGKAARDPEVLVEVARCLAVCATADGATRDGYRKQAVDAVAGAIKAGYQDEVGLTTEPDLASIRDDPEFLALVAALRR